MSEANVNKKTKGSRKVRTIRTNSKVKVHDENEIAGIGDLVRIEETRPLSKDKHFRLVEIVEKAR